MGKELVLARDRIVDGGWRMVDPGVGAAMVSALPGAGTARSKGAALQSCRSSRIDAENESALLM